MKTTLPGVTIITRIDRAPTRFQALKAPIVKDDVDLLVDHVIDQRHLTIQRGQQVLWQASLVSGERSMSHSLANLEHHHFKYPAHRRPGDVHVHFFGTATLSFSDGVKTQEGDEFEIEARPFTLPLRNRLVRSTERQPAVRLL